MITTYGHDLTTPLALLCCISIVLVAAIQPPHQIETFVLCFDAVTLAAILLCDDWELRRLCREQIAARVIQDEEDLGNAKPYFRPLGFGDDFDEDTPLLAPRIGACREDGTQDHHIAESHDIEINISMTTSTLVTIYQRLRNIRKSQDIMIGSLKGQLAEAKALLDTERDQDRLLEDAEKVDVRVSTKSEGLRNTLITPLKMTLSPECEPSIWPSRLRAPKDRR